MKDVRPEDFISEKSTRYDVIDLPLAPIKPKAKKTPLPTPLKKPSRPSQSTKRVDQSSRQSQSTKRVDRASRPKRSTKRVDRSSRLKQSTRSVDPNDRPSESTKVVDQMSRPEQSTELLLGPIPDRPTAFYLPDSINKQIDEAVKYYAKTHKIKADRSAVVAALLGKKQVWNPQALDSMLPELKEQLSNRLEARLRKKMGIFS